MKRIYIIILFGCIIPIVVKAQKPLTVDPGKDTNYCSTSSIILGGNPTASGGVKPYTYKWFSYIKSTHKLDSTLLDSSDANPGFYGDNNAYIIKVTVTDAKNNVATDSLIIGVSSFSVLTGSGIHVSNPNQDSVTLEPQTVGGISPISYKWSPEIGLSNSNIKYPNAKLANPATTYSVEITDSIGCKTTEDGFIVTAIKDGNLSTGFVSFKNPISNGGTMNFTSDLLGSTLRVCTVGGVVVYETKVQELSIPLGQLITKAGIYFYTVTTVEGKVISGRFVRE